MPLPRPTVADLFCGAGGLTLGFEAAGFASVYGIDSDPDAVATYAANLDGRVVCGDVRDAGPLRPADVVAGGPPCQGFSSAGSRAGGDDRNTLVRTFAETVAEAAPRAFVFENVEGFLTLDGGRFLLDLLDPLVGAGYSVRVRKVNAANYGVPQNRKRVLAVGGRGWTPDLPAPSRSTWGTPGSRNVGRGLPPTDTLAAAIGDLPPAADPTAGSAEPAVCGHTARPLTGAALERAKLLAEGQCMRDLPPELWHESYGQRANRRVSDGTPTARRGGAPTGVRRLRWDEPCKTVTGGSGGDFLHPAEHRGLTPRECARVQGFPDRFCFRGNRADQHRLIGNAVPPPLAAAVGAALLAGWEDPALRTDAGGVAEFTPTASSGLSPALRGVAETVARRYHPVPVPVPVPTAQKRLWPGNG